MAAPRGVAALARLSGSFALAGVAAAGCSSCLAEPSLLAGLAACFHPATVLFDGSTEQQGEEAPWKQKVMRLAGGRGPETFYALDAAPNGVHFTYKVYPVELRVRSLQSAWSLQNITVSVLRCAALILAPLINRYFKDVQQLEEAADEQGEDLEMPAFPFAEAYNVLATNGALLYGVFRDRALDVTRILLSQKLLERWPRRLSWKFLKDAPQSVTRKQRRDGFWARPYGTVKTVIRAAAIAATADVLVSTYLDFCRIWAAPGVPVRRRTGLTLQSAGVHVARNIISLAAAAIVTAAAQMVLPGIAAYYAGLGADLALSVLYVGPRLPPLYLVQPPSQSTEGREPKNREREEWQPLVILVALSAAVVLLSLSDLDTSAPYVAGQETVFLPDASPALA